MADIGSLTNIIRANRGNPAVALARVAEALEQLQAQVNGFQTNTNTTVAAVKKTVAAQDQTPNPYGVSGSIQITVDYAHAHSGPDGRLKVPLVITYLAPSPLGIFAGVECSTQIPYTPVQPPDGTPIPPIINWGKFPCNTGGPQTITIEVDVPGSTLTGACWLMPYSTSGKAIPLTDASASLFTIGQLPGSGIAGQEWAPLVTGLTGTVRNPTTAGTESGIQMFDVVLNWTEPSSSEYGGAWIVLKDITHNNQVKYGPVSRGTTTFTTPAIPVPKENTDYKIYVVSVKPGGLMRWENSIQTSTPNYAFTVLKGNGTISAGRLLASSIGSGLGLASGVLGVPPEGITAELVAAYAINNNHLDRVGVDKIAIVDADIVNLSAAKITAGTLVSGVVYAGSISANQITSGTLSADRITAGTISGTGLLTVNTTQGIWTTDIVTTSLTSLGHVQSSTGYQIGGNDVINSSGQFVGFGVDCNYGIAGTGFNIHGGGTGQTGSVTVVVAIRNNAGTYEYKSKVLQFTGGIITSIGADSAWTSF